MSFIGNGATEIERDVAVGHRLPPQDTAAELRPFHLPGNRKSALRVGNWTRSWTSRAPTTSLGMGSGESKKYPPPENSFWCEKIRDQCSLWTKKTCETIVRKMNSFLYVCVCQQRIICVRIATFGGGGILRLLVDSSTLMLLLNLCGSRASS